MDIPFSFWKEASPKRKRIYSVIFMLILAIATTLIGTLVPISDEYARLINDTLNQTVTNNTANGTLIQHIFLNNFLLCLAMFIPLAGAVFGLFVMLNTGIALGATLRLQSITAASAAVPNISLTTAILGLIGIGLTFLLEYVSYSIGISESIWLFRRLTQRRWRELKNTAILIGIVVAFLIIASLVETWVITALG